MRLDFFYRAESIREHRADERPACRCLKLRLISSLAL